LFYYRAYGLRIQSDIPLPELPSCASGCDVAVRVTPPAPAPQSRSIEWDQAGREARFFFPAAGTFVVRGGSEVLVTPEMQADSLLLRLYVQGMMLAAVLAQRGLFVLHSSVVNLNGQAVAFIGPVGGGKSSFASAFHSLGCPVLADDNAAIRMGPNPSVIPGFPSLKLYPAVAEAIGYSAAQLQPIHESQPKQAQAVEHGFSTHSLALQGIYSLDREARCELSRLTPVEAIQELIRHSVPSRWGARCDGLHLKTCAALATTVPMFRVRTFRRLDEIAGLARRIHQHSESQQEQREVSVAVGRTTS
jgi:hypothetical protein